MSQTEYKNITIIGSDFTANIEVQIIDDNIKTIEHENIELYDEKNNKFENDLLKEILTYENGNIFKQIMNSEEDNIEIYRDDIKNVKTIEEFKQEVIDYSQTIFDGEIILEQTVAEIGEQLAQAGYNEDYIIKMTKHKNQMDDFCLNVLILKDLEKEKYINLKKLHVEDAPKSKKKKKKIYNSIR